MNIDTRQRYEKPVVACGFNAWVDVHAPMDVVFRFLSDEQELRLWWASKCMAEPKAGGKLHFVWVTEEHETTGDAIFRRFEPPNLLQIEWTHQNGEAILCNGEDHRGMLWPALNTYELAQINANTTRVHLHDPGLNSGPEYAPMWQATCDGWGECLSRLKRVVENRQREEVTRQVRKNSRKK